MELVEKCEVAKGKSKNNTEAIDRALELEELGFKGVSDELIKKIELGEKLKKIVEYKYIKITEANIKGYLKGKVDRYNREHKKEKSGNITATFMGQGYTIGREGLSTTASPVFGSFLIGTPSQSKYPAETIQETTNDYYSTSKDTIGKFVWTETPIDQYKTIPPQLTLDTLKTHQDRHIFDYFTIAKVNQMVDPLLLGRIEGVTDRFFLCQWGDDIQVDDLI